MNSNPSVGDIYPCLVYNDARAAIDWLGRAFGFTERMVVPGPDGTIMHSELSLGEAVIMVSSPSIEMGTTSPQRLTGLNQSVCVHVDDPDSHYQNAVAAGASIVRELRDEDYGSRGYMAKDIEGQLWYFGTYRPGSHWAG